MHGNGLLDNPEDWKLLALILGAPLFGAFFNGVFGKRLGKPAVRLMALLAMSTSFIGAVYTFLQIGKFRQETHHKALAVWESLHPGQASPQHLETGATKLKWLAWKWMSVAGRGGDSRIDVDVKFSVDELSGVMMLIITGVGLLIHIYSTSYMAKDPGYHRFFAYLNLFIFSMLVLVLGDNMPLMFVGWEGVGLCSYLLIGFWFEKTANAAAGRKAFIANRVGDVGIIVGMLLIAYYTNALDWTGIEKGSSGLVERIVVVQRTAPSLPITVSAATAVCLALFIGCTGKSAQIPLYVWLPDAMAGPTPVSALIHAATMVTSGLYLICRLSVVFSFSPFAMMVIACTGAATALFAATIGLVQNDIKKVLAYSTVSQLGFMFLGVGVGSFGAGFFHVLTHAFFKACLFLGAGSVIHAMHRRIHDDVASQDMRNMGGLRKYMPWTYAAMGASTLAIAGMPLTSGFFSKDGILFHVFANKVEHPFAQSARETLAALSAKGTKTGPFVDRLNKVAHSYFEAPTWLGYVLFVVAIIAATCTAFYMFRLMFMTFWGEFKGWSVDKAAVLRPNPFENVEPLLDDDEHAHHDHDVVDLTVPDEAPHESPWQMAVPVGILGVFALFAGFLYAEPLHIEPLAHWLDPVFRTEVGGKFIDVSAKLREGTEKLEWPLMVPGVLAFSAGLFLAYNFYVKGGGKKPAEMAASMPRLHRALYNKWYVDEIYDATVIGGTDALAEGAAALDTWVVDGILAKLTALIARGVGGLLRRFQTGVVHVYGAGIALGTLAIVYFFARPHAEFTIQQEGDQFTVEAAPGLGYEYRYVEEGQATPEFGSSAAARRALTVKLDEKKTLTLEVRNAFGATTTRTIELRNPKPEPVAPAGLERAAAPGRFDR